MENKESRWSNGIVCSRCYATEDADRESMKYSNKEAKVGMQGSKEDKGDRCTRKIMQECGCGDDDNEI